MARSTAQNRETPWNDGDPGKKIGLNVPFPEPLMLQLDYLIQNKAIRSKSSFIREAVEAAATAEINRLWRVQEAVQRMDAEEAATGRRRPSSRGSTPG